MNLPSRACRDTNSWADSALLRSEALGEEVTFKGTVKFNYRFILKADINSRLEHNIRLTMLAGLTFLTSLRQRFNFLVKILFVLTKRWAQTE